jgi:hypothetical protein
MEMRKRRKRVSGAGDASMLGRRNLGLLIMFFEGRKYRRESGRGEDRLGAVDNQRSRWEYGAETIELANYLDKIDVHAFRFLQMVYERSAG